MFATFAAIAVFLCAISLLFTTKTDIFWQNLNYFYGKAWELKMVLLPNFLILLWLKIKIY
jgi:hypothetical protein